MMADLIERSAAIDAVDEALRRIIVAPVGKDILDRVPTVDAVPVVRCKNCKYFDPQYPGMSRGDCTKDNLCCPYDWDYCSDGDSKDREDGNDGI